MKNSWIIFFLLCSCTLSSTDVSEVSNEESQIPADAIVQDYSTPGLQKATVKVEETIMAEGDFLNGKHHGTWTTYDPQGKVNSITTYLNGQKQGTELSFDNQGYVSSKAYYNAGQLEGEFLVFVRRTIVERKNYKNGVQHGPQRKYYSGKGNVLEESTYVDGKIDGVARWYDINGQLSIEYTYDMGELIEEN